MRAFRGALVLPHAAKRAYRLRLRPEATRPIAISKAASACLMTTPDQHTRAMARGAWQCPQCSGGWQQFQIETDKAVCPSCGYAGGNTNPDVSTGALCHVSLRIDPKDALAAHDGELHKVIAKFSYADHDKQFDTLAAQEAKLHESIEAAHKKINDLAAIGIRTLFSMGDNPVVTPTDRLELRLVLCKVTE